MLNYMSRVLELIHFLKAFELSSKHYEFDIRKTFFARREINDAIHTFP